MLCVCNVDVFEAALEPGQIVGELHAAVVQTRLCTQCGTPDTDAWVIDGEMPFCDACKTPKVAGTSSCRQCGAGPKMCAVLSYAGCDRCRPEAKLRDKFAAGVPGNPAMHGPASATLARSAALFAATSIEPPSTSVGKTRPVSYTHLTLPTILLV